MKSERKVREEWERVIETVWLLVHSQQKSKRQRDWQREASFNLLYTYEGFDSIVLLSLLFFTLKPFDSSRINSSLLGLSLWQSLVSLVLAFSFSLVDFLLPVSFPPSPLHASSLMLSTDLSSNWSSCSEWRDRTLRGKTKREITQLVGFSHFSFHTKFLSFTWQ